MADPRIIRMAQVLVRYSVAVKPGEPVLIHSTDLAVIYQAGRFVLQ